MGEVGIRALKQNASERVATARHEGSVTSTERSAAVAVMSDIRESRLEELIRTGQARTPRAEGDLLDLQPLPNPCGVSLSDTILSDREESAL